MGAEIDRPEISPRLAARVKSTLNRLAARFGAEIIRSNPDARSQLMREADITLVLDVGAYHGEYGQHLRSAGYRGRIVSFEPQQSAFDVLQHATSRDPDWQCRYLALGDRSASATLRLASRPEASSLLDLDPTHVAGNPEWAYVGEQVVVVESLDSLRSEVVRPNDRVLLKLDAQGSELGILAGAEETLSQVGGVEVELTLASIYRDQPLLPDVAGFLYEHGFHLVWLERILVDRRTRYLLQVDALFKRARPAAERGASNSA